MLIQIFFFFIAQPQDIKISYLQDLHKDKFVMSGAITWNDFTPVGLYIENGIVKERIDYFEEDSTDVNLSHPIGIFYITNDNKAGIVDYKDFKNENIKHAIQSQPMILINGEVNTKIIGRSKHTENAVGILPCGAVLMVVPREKVSIEELALFFKSKGCREALYLGFNSSAHTPKNCIRCTNVHGYYFSAN